MFTLEKMLHGLAILLRGFFLKFVPDRIPVTFLGTGASEELCESIAQTNVRKVLIVTDRVLEQIGLVDRITESLRGAGLAWSTYADVEPDPTFPQVEAGLARFERDDCDAIIALGGGSVMDAAKLIGAMATNGGDLRKLEGLMKVRQLPIPLYAIPTTAGTGSEVTVVAVVSDPETHEKKFVIDPKLLPVMAALDPTLMTGLPPAITAATGMDALTHAVEAFVARTASPQTDAWALAAVRLVFENLPAATRDGGNLPARKAMVLASYYAGLAFTRTSVGYVHAIAHSFGARYRTPHGLANATALPFVLEFSKRPARARLARLADAIGQVGANDDEKAGRFIAAVRGLMAKIDIAPALAALKEEHIPAIARQARTEARMNYPVPRYMSQPQCEAVLRQMLVPK